MISRFPCLRLEGGLIAADIIDQIADGNVVGQRPSGFGVENRRLIDEISAAWTDARVYWDAFQHRLNRLSSDDLATTPTREQWMSPLLSLFGYELKYTARAEEVDGVTYAISHRADGGENAPPVHIVGCRQELGKRSESGRPRLSPHSLVQEFLNRTDHVWAIVSNGFSLRLLRDSQLIRRPSYIEFDLKQMMEGDKFSDFALLYRLIHRTRLPRAMEDAPECLLERYYRLTVEQGGRVRERLRDGVEESLKLLAGAFLQHPKNTELCESWRAGRFTASQFYQQLLRLIYRMLFLMVAEERQLISTNKVYLEHYSVSRLRRLLEVRAAFTDHEDLWLGLRNVFHIFQDDELARILDVTPLDGDLFNSARTDILNSASVANCHLLKALWHLSKYREDRGAPWRRINYGALDVEELGSVYESLLDFQPVITERNGQLVFDLVTGTERKTTGSYYTPPELVNELIESALVPVIGERLDSAKSTAEKEHAILNTRICDPACGSGHFLLAAARRLAKELAKATTGEVEPSPDEQREAIRRVVAHCIYGVDRNPLSVDLCKVALWIESTARGRPLTFIDHRIRCGDGLVGVLDLSVLKEGIPDDAFEPVAGDERPIARELKRRNRNERTGFQSLRFEPSQALHSLAEKQKEFAELSDDSTEQVRRKASAFERGRAANSIWEKENTACNLWTAAFFSDLTAENDLNRRIPTTESLRDYLERPGAVDGRLIGHINALANRLHFFHWPLEFPEVFDEGGFDVLLGNPPFLGGLKISTSYGDKYRNYLSSAYDPFKGTADLCAAFYRRAFTLLRPHCRFGMVATNSIGQGDSREAGLAVVVRQGGTIVFGHRFVKWTGAANVEVNLVGVHKGDSKGTRLLDYEAVSFISSRLADEPEAEAEPLEQNHGKAFIGDYVRGIGFVLDATEAVRFLDDDPRNRHCLLPYLNGEDLNNNPAQEGTRYVICFHDWALEKAEAYPGLLSMVRARVKPERDMVKERHERENWWLFARYRCALRQAIVDLDRALVRAEVSDYHMISFVPKGLVCSHMVVVFAFDDDYHFALLQSNIHEQWVRRMASTMRTDIRYTPTDCFATFPFPKARSIEAKSLADRIGKEYHEHRRQVMLSRNIGLTKTYNLFHNPDCSDADIARLHDLHDEMDRAVLACYGWHDLDLGHGFHQNDRCQTRFTISLSARREVLRRLLELNLKIHEEETKL